jgi:tetratricopeptide (TPR) repeat protein
VIEGSVRASGRGRRVRITAQLIEARSGFHLWSETYDREPDDILEVQDEISRAIAQKLQIELAPSFFGASVGETADPEAYRLLLRAQHALRTPTAESFARATLLLEDAIRRDPDYGRAHGALASTVAWQGERGWAPRDSAFARAEALARRSLRLGETPEAHVALARLAEMRAWSPDSADSHFRRALALNPADARTLQFRALFLARSGRGDEAVAAAERATELDPLYPGSWTNYAIVLSMLDRPHDAVAALEHARRIAPEDRIVLANLANFYAEAGRLDDAVATLERVLELNPDDLATRGLRVHLLFQRGRVAGALAALAELERNQAFPRVDLAFLYTNTQDIERILDLLEESARRREPELIRIRSPDVFRGMRHHPRFVRLLDTLEQK